MSDPKIDLDVGVVYQSPQSMSNRYDIYMSDEVCHVIDYISMVDTFVKANPKDNIKLWLGNLGGSCHACIYLVNFIRNCKAKVDVFVMAPCASAGATLALCGDSLTVMDNTYLMFHNYSSVEYGKGNELNKSMVESRKWIHRYFKDIHSPFLTDKELQIITEDKDVYIQSYSRTLPARIKRHFKVHGRK